MAIKHPEELELEDLEDNDLVLVDYRLGIWAREVDVVSRSPRDGLAVAEILRSHLRANSPDGPTAFALYTAHIGDLSGDLPVEVREHVVARLHDLEWAFSKETSEAAPALTTRVHSLARAVSRLPERWPDDDPDETRSTVEGLMGLDRRRRWRDQAWKQIELAHPPLYALAEPSQGLAFIRWFLHRILPYPTFLLDDYHLASRLRVTVSSLRDSLAPNSPFWRWLEPVRFKGVLDDFNGSRWWRAGVDDLIVSDVGERAFAREGIPTAIAAKTGAELDPVPASNPVVCLDERFRPLADLHDADAAVRIQPDDWPAVADYAWALIADVEKSERLRSIVLEVDRERLEESGLSTAGG